MSRPAKGTRIRAVTRLTPTDHAKLVRTATRNGVTVSEYLATIIQRHLND